MLMLNRDIYRTLFWESCNIMEIKPLNNAKSCNMLNLKLCKRVFYGNQLNIKTLFWDIYLRAVIIDA